MAADLARLEASRREFIAKISHDLRTPLTAIKGVVVNLQDTAPAEMQPSLAMMDEQTERLIRLVDDLLTLSRLQRGELRLRRAPSGPARRGPRGGRPGRRKGGAPGRVAGAGSGRAAARRLGGRRPLAAGGRQPAGQRPPGHAGGRRGGGARERAARTRSS